MAAELTLGAEEELHLIDLATSKLSARAPQLLSRLPPRNYAAEIQRTTVETNTEAVGSLAGLREELIRLRRGIVDVAAAESLGIAAVGTAPMSAFADFELTATGRYGRMQEQYRLLVDEQLICGLQIHVGSATATSPFRSCSGSPPCRSCSPSRPARPTGTSRTPATPASGRLFGNDGPPPAPPDGSDRPASTTS